MDELDKNDKQFTISDYPIEFTLFLRRNILKILEYKKYYIFVNVVFMLSWGFYLNYFLEDYYQTSITVISEGSTSPAASSPFADLLNIQSSTPILLYQTLLLSEPVLEQVIFQKYKSLKHKDSVDLPTYFDIKLNKNLDSITARRVLLLSTFGKLKNQITANADVKYGSMTVVVEWGEPQMAADIANTLIESLDDQIRKRRKSRFSEQLKYVKQRSEQVRDSLFYTEEQLKIFNIQNRNMGQSPELVLEQARLGRTTQLLQSIYMDLSKQLEVSKIELIKETPVLTVKETAKSPVWKSGPPKVKYFFALLIFVNILLIVSLLLVKLVKRYITLLYRGE